MTLRTRGGWALRLSIAFVAFVTCLAYRTPLLAAIRGEVFVTLALIAPLALALEVRAWRRSRAPRWRQAWWTIIWALTTGLLLWTEARFRVTRAAVLDADPVALADIGEHFMVGYRDFDEVRALVERDAIAGVYISGRNVRAVGAARLRDELARLQALRRARARPPLLIAADQEGGVVSHLSPPLTRLPALRELVGSRAAARAQGETHGRELRAYGVTINFAPVVDLRVDVDRGFDRHSRIDQRAISRDPAVVTAIAGAYCDGLRAQAVACTLKHFPGLGRVTSDTHFFAGQLTEPRATLAAEDWAPFRELAGGPATLIMIGHTIVTEVDPDRPASQSAALIDGIVRREWGHDGPLITDDLSMFPISSGPGGVGAGSERALAAGIDLLLIAFDPDLYYEAAAHLLARRGALERAASRRRIHDLRRALIGVQGREREQPRAPVASRPGGGMVAAASRTAEARVSAGEGVTS